MTDKPSPKTFQCRWCHREIKIKKPRFALQQQGGHEANCPENPDVKAKRAAAKSQVLDQAPAQASPPALPPIPAGSISPQMSSASPSASALQPFLAVPAVPGISGVPMIPGQLPAVVQGEFIPPEVCAEWVLMIVSANFDIAVAYAKRKALKDPPVEIEMSSATSKWLGQMISREIGPQSSSWGLIVGGLAPFILIPWISIAAQGGMGKIGEFIRGLKDKMGLGNEIKTDEAEQTAPAGP